MPIRNPSLSGGEDRKIAVRRQPLQKRKTLSEKTNQKQKDGGLGSRARALA
jgi:hypothetical protein